MRRTSGGGLGWWIGALVAFVLVVRGVGGDRKPHRAALPPVESPAYYVSEVEEGIGAAVAILVDTSGSMAEAAPGDGRPKYEVARQALEEVVSATDAFAKRRPDVPVKLAIYGFASSPWVVFPMQAYDGAAVRRALSRLPGPGGGTAIGNATPVRLMEVVRLIEAETGKRAQIIDKQMPPATSSARAGARSPSTSSHSTRARPTSASCRRRAATCWPRGTRRACSSP